MAAPRAEDILLEGAGAGIRAVLGQDSVKAFAAGYVATAAVLATRRMPLLAYAVCCVLGGKAAQLAHRAATDLHQLAQASRDETEPAP